MLFDWYSVQWKAWINSFWTNAHSLSLSALFEWCLINALRGYKIPPKEAHTEAAWPSGLGHLCCNPEVPVQSFYPATSGICFSVVPSSNPRSRFVNSRLVCLCQLGFLTIYITFIWNICFLLFQWYACKLAKRSACIAKCMATIKKNTFFFIVDYFRNLQGFSLFRTSEKTFWLVLYLFIVSLRWWFYGTRYYKDLTMILQEPIML